jgi:polyisoprenyl-teichoic acid--peptidoglycan teichoic acid transferase
MPRPKKENKKESKKGSKKKFKKFMIFLLIAMVITAAAGVSYAYFIAQRLSKGEAEAEAKKVQITKPVNVLLLGVDAGDYDSAKPDKSPKRSDTMMVVHYNPQNEKVYVLSIPRDTRVKVNGHYEKINAAHAIGGPETAIKTVEKLLDIEINYYAKINYKGFRECIDAIGGVDVVVPHDMDYDAWDISIHFKKGENVHLDGEQAERFVRWRKNNNGEGYAMGDLGRISTQQEFMMKVVEKLKTPAGMVRVIPLVNTASQYIETNMDSKNMLAYALKINGVEAANIERKILDGEPKYIGGVSYFVHSESKSEEYLNNFRQTYSADGQKIVDKRDIKVIILNSTGVNGLASEYKGKMEKLGYNVVEIGNYSKKVNSTIINDYSERGYGELVYKDLKYGNVVEKEEENPPANIVVILGKDILK